MTNKSWRESLFSVSSPRLLYLPLISATTQSWWRIESFKIIERNDCNQGAGCN